MYDDEELFIQIDQVRLSHIYQKEEYSRRCLREAFYFTYIVYANGSRIHTFMSNETYIFE